MSKRCYIVDNDPKSILDISELINSVPGLELVGSTVDPYYAVRQLTTGIVTADITFIDIEMPEMSGIDLAGLLMGHTKVVFITAHQNFAALAFEQDAAIDFIVKPVSLERFVKGVDKVKLRLENERTLKGNMIEDHFFIKLEGKGKYHKILIKDIIYIEGNANYLNIQLPEKSHLAHMTMLAVEEMLLPMYFLRIHKSYLVNLNRIEAIDGNMIEVDKKVKLPIGPNYRKAFFDRMNPFLPKSKK